MGVDGGYANPRWARRIQVYGNNVKNSAGGGIWGSMGQNVTVSHNQATTALDVGIDLEGCLDSTADSNTVSDGHNGALAIFVVTKNVTFSYNTVSTSNAGWPLFRVYNSSLDPTYGTGSRTNMGSTLRNNTFSCSSGIDSIDDHNGPAVLTLTGNHLTNVQIAITSGLDGNGNPTGFNGVGANITGNTLLFSTDVSYAFAGIDSFYYFGNATVSQNSVTYSGTTKGNKTGIRVRMLP